MVAAIGCGVYFRRTEAGVIINLNAVVGRPIDAGPSEIRCGDALMPTVTWGRQAWGCRARDDGEAARERPVPTSTSTARPHPPVVGVERQGGRRGGGSARGRGVELGGGETGIVVHLQIVGGGPTD